MQACFNVHVHAHMHALTCACTRTHTHTHTHTRTLPLLLPGTLVNLQVLDLGQNAIEVVPDELCNCTGLTSLDLQHNEITELPLNIGQLKNLKRLGLRYVCTCVYMYVCKCTFSKCVYVCVLFQVLLLKNQHK